MSPSTQMSHTHFWLCTIGLLLVWFLVVATASPYEEKPPGLLKFWGKNQAQEQRLENNCKSLCEQCGCIGFYCGEQCLCEYNKLHNGQRNVAHSGQKHDDTKFTRTIRNSDHECITRMQREANTKKLPYEVLIQGPSTDRFIRTAMQLAQDLARTALAATTKSDMPQKRSTISIYRPFTPTINNMLLPSQSSDNRKTQLKDPLGRLRRSTDHLDWFTDFANTLVRPAPRRKSEVSSVNASGSGGGNKKRETQRSEEDATREKTESWFTDHPNLLLRPAPLFRRKTSQKPTKTAAIAAVAPTEEDEKEEDHDDSSYMNNNSNNHQNHAESESGGDSEEREEEEAPLAPMRKPLKNTIRNTQESELGENVRHGLRTRLHDNGDVMSNPFDGGNLELLPKRFRNDFVEVFDSWMKGQQVTEASIQQPAVPARAAPSSIMLPWFRPGHFLQRVQQALN